MVELVIWVRVLFWEPFCTTCLACAAVETTLSPKSEGQHNQPKSSPCPQTNIDIRMSTPLTTVPLSQMEAVKLKLSDSSVTDKSNSETELGSNSTASFSPVVPPSSAPAPYTPSSTEVEATAAAKAKQALLDKLTTERNQLLDRWADPKSLGLTTEEIKINMFLRTSLRYLFGQTGFDPPVPARNPVSVSMHNPRFAVALWALNTEAYRRRGNVSLTWLLRLCVVVSS